MDLPKMLDERLYVGSVMGGLESWLRVRSVRTLELRLMKQSENAQSIVDALNGAVTGKTVGTGLSQTDAEIIKSVVKEVFHASLQTEDYKTWLRKRDDGNHQTATADRRLDAFDIAVASDTGKVSVRF
jgi:cystathionine beta-lyase/cystathionine gamma-synthase